MGQETLLGCPNQALNLMGTEWLTHDPQCGSVLPGCLWPERTPQWKLLVPGVTGHCAVTHPTIRLIHYLQIRFVWRPQEHGRWRDGPERTNFLSVHVPLRHSGGSEGTGWSGLFMWQACGPNQQADTSISSVSLWMCWLISLACTIYLPSVIQCPCVPVVSPLFLSLSFSCFGESKLWKQKLKSFGVLVWPSVFVKRPHLGGDSSARPRLCAGNSWEGQGTTKCSRLVTVALHRGGIRDRIREVQVAGWAWFCSDSVPRRKVRMRDGQSTSAGMVTAGLREWWGTDTVESGLNSYNQNGKKQTQKAPLPFHPPENLPHKKNPKIFFRGELFGED